VRGPSFGELERSAQRALNAGETLASRARTGREVIRERLVTRAKSSLGCERYSINLRYSRLRMPNRAHAWPPPRAGLGWLESAGSNGRLLGQSGATHRHRVSYNLQ
jgi:hypothetical protein